MYYQPDRKIMSHILTKRLNLLLTDKKVKLNKVTKQA